MRILVISLALAVTFSGQEPAQRGVIGKWRSADVASSGLGAIFEFHQDGTAEYSAALISEGTYRVVGTDAIILRDKDGNTEKEEIEWDSSDRIRIEDEAAGKSVALTRAGKGSPNSIAGEWKYEQVKDGKKLEGSCNFYGDGRDVWSVPVRTQRGHYLVNGSKITLEFADRPALQGPFSVSGNSLTLPRPGGGNAKFERY